MDAHIFIFGEVGGFGVDEADILRDIAQAKKDKAETIIVQISSFGGYVYSGKAIYNALKTSGIPVRVEIIGQAFSIASYIAMAGDEILIAEKGEVMIHPAWTMTEGNAEQLREQADELEKMSNEIFAVYLERGADEAIIRPYFDEERIMTAQEAIDAGLATGLLEPMKAVAKFNHNNNNNQKSKMDNPNVIDKVLAKLNKLMKHTIKNASITAESGDVLYFEGDVIEVGTSVYSDETLETPIADGDYVEGDSTYSVAEGVVTEIVVAEEEEEEEEAPSEEIVALQATIDEQAATIAELTATMKSERNEQAEIQKELNAIKKTLVAEKIKFQKNRKSSGGIEFESVADKMKRLQAENSKKYKG